MTIEKKVEQEKEYFQELVGKTILAKIGNSKKSKPIFGEVVQGKIKVYYVCDESMNCIGRRQRKEIKLRNGEEIYFILRDKSKRINSFYKLYPNNSFNLLEIGCGAY